MNNTPSPSNCKINGKEPSIGDKIVETLYLNRVTSENKRIRTPPLSPPFKVGVFVVFYRQLEQGHNIARRGWGRKVIFPPFEVHKTEKSPLLGEVSELILSPIVCYRFWHNSNTNTNKQRRRLLQDDFRSIYL